MLKEGLEIIKENPDIWKKGLKIIAENHDKISEFLESLGDMPNMETGTMGGKVFWNTLAEINGWKLQQNKILKNCRLIDPNNVRKAWGGELAMKEAFEKIIEL